MALSRQGFGAAVTPVERWLLRFPLGALDEHSAYMQWIKSRVAQTDHGPTWG